MLIMMMAFMFALLIPSAIYLMSCLLYMRYSLNTNKTSAFECGFEPDNTARVPFSTRFFLLILIFVVFDVEIVLVMPFPVMVSFNQSIQMLYLFIFFMLILLIGLLHEWNEGTLNWSN